MFYLHRMCKFVSVHSQIRLLNIQQLTDNAPLLIIQQLTFEAMLLHFQQSTHYSPIDHLHMTSRMTSRGQDGRLDG